MTLQFVHDAKGNTTGVFIPIEEWQSLKSKCHDLQEEESSNSIELAPWQTQIIEERLTDYYKNPKDVADFDKTMDDIEDSL
jgi:hypothetical protein